MDRFEAVYLAPHLDDAVLSCGGQIVQRTAVGERVLVATIMAGDPDERALSGYASSLHERWALAHEAVAARRAEDIEACRLLGAETWHGRVPDCIYRVDPQHGGTLYNSDEAIFGSVAAVEAGDLVDKIAAVLQTLPPAQEVFAPLTIGNHVDHQLVRRAAEHAFGASRLRYYEDYPYVQDPNVRDAFWVAERAARGGWQKHTIPLTDTAVKMRCAAIMAYASQISTFFRGEADLRTQVATYTTACGGENVWRVVDL
jgi:LmbE family N-acetylglucosaminyl deacetylase